MISEFYERYKDYTKGELFRIVLSYDEFQPDAVLAERQIIEEQNWTDELNIQFEEVEISKTKAEELYEQEIVEKAEYYKNVVEIKKDANSFQVRTGDIFRLEAALNDNGIEFFHEDKNIGAQLDVYPTHTYFFKNEDTEKVDQIVKSLGLVTAPYTDIKPFFGFQIKVVIVVVFVLALVFILLNVFG